MYNEEIFKTYDIRGIYGQDFDDEFAYQLGNKIGLQTTLVVVGRDGRPSSGAVHENVLRGAIDAGIRVVDVGECSTPLFYYSLSQVGSGASGIMVTASHNPSEYNGFKVIGQDLRLWGGGKLKEVFTTTELSGQNQRVQQIEKRDFTNQYIQEVIKLSEARPTNMQVGVFTNGSSLNILDKLGQEAGIEFIEGYKGGFNIEMDTDQDRILFWDQDNLIPAEYIFLLLVNKIGFRKVVHDLRFSKVVGENLGEWGTEFNISAAGRTFIHQAMIDNNAELGAELSGHFYFKQMSYLEAPELLLLYVIRILQSEGKNIFEMIKEYKKYPKSPEISIPQQGSWNKEQVLQKLKEKYSNAQISELDGLTVDLWDSEGWWANIRQSHTESVTRLVVESKKEILLNEKVQEIQGLL